MHMEKIKQHVSLESKGELPKSLGDGSVPGTEVFDLVVPDPGTPTRLAPVTDLAPIVVATYLGGPRNGKIAIRGTAAATGTVRKIQVNGMEARAVRPNFAEWEITLPATSRGFTVRAEDAAGNISVAKLA